MIEPFYSDGGIEIYHGDALEVLYELLLAGRRFRCVAMDPPYASGTRTEARKGSSGAMVRAGRFANKPIENDQMTTAGFIWLMREAALLFRDMLSDGDSVFSFIDWRQWPNLLGPLEPLRSVAERALVGVSCECTAHGGPDHSEEGPCNSGTRYPLRLIVAAHPERAVCVACDGERGGWIFDGKDSPASKLDPCTVCSGIGKALGSVEVTRELGGLTLADLTAVPTMAGPAVLHVADGLSVLSYPTLTALEEHGIREALAIALGGSDG